MNGLKQMDPRPLLLRKAEGREVVERKTGAADDDPFGEFEQAIRLTPAWEIEKAVRSDKVEEHGCRHCSMQFGQRIDGVVRQAIGARSINRGRLKAPVLLTSESCHGQPIGEWG